MNARALVALLPIAAIVACSAAPSDETTEGTDSTSEALSKSVAPGGGPAPMPTVIGPSNPYGPVPAYPPTPAIYNPNIDPSCSMESEAREPGWAAKNAELATYGCTPVFHWLTGYASGWLGGILTLCSDTPALRAHFHGLTNNPMEGAADKCIPKAPTGQVWVELEAFVGPNCPSGCAHRNDGGW